MVDLGCFGIFQSSIDWSRSTKLSSYLSLRSEEEDEEAEEIDFLEREEKECIDDIIKYK
jgi:hypothetical protein